jgi:hypothetical protein
MGKTFRNNDKEKNFSNKAKPKAKKINPKEKRPNKSFDYSSSEFD